MAERLYIAPDGVRFGGGKFDSAYFYLRGGAGSADFPMPKGETLEIRSATRPTLGLKCGFFKFDNGRTTHEYRTSGVYTEHTLAASTFTADVVTVTTT